MSLQALVRKSALSFTLAIMNVPVILCNAMPFLAFTSGNISCNRIKHFYTTRRKSIAQLLFVHILWLFYSYMPYNLHTSIAKCRAWVVILAKMRQIDINIQDVDKVTICYPWTEASTICSLSPSTVTRTHHIYM
jgi:hypothetical protein